MGFKNIVNKKELLQFKDRTNIINNVKLYYQCMMKQKPFFQIVSISGMGGIGKSRLLNELKFILQKQYGNDPEQRIIYLTLEIANSDYFLNALTILRSQITEICPLFDYAFLTYWKRTQITKLDSSFMNIIKHQWSDFSKLIGSMFSIPIKMASISFDTILDFLEKSFVFIKEKYYKSFFDNYSKDIVDYSTDNLKDCLAGFLGMDMNRIFCQKNLCVFVDSYERYPSSNYVDWLMDLMEQTNTGLFIVSGREKISYPDEIVNFVASSSLEVLPVESAWLLLKENLPNVGDSVIQHIINKSERLPIYLDLAISTYKNLRSSNSKEFDDTSFFMYKNKEDITKQFFNHLKPAHQEFLLTLSFLQLFDQEIYNYITILSPNSSLVDYNDFQLLSIISNVENDNDFYKVHDVLSTNVIEILNIKTRYFLFQKYLEHIVTKTVLYATDTQKIFLYKHIINMIIKNKFILQQYETELFLDLFFSLKQTLHVILPTGIPELENYEPLKDICYFTKAIANEREETVKRLDYLQFIDFKHNLFGKHNKSLNIIYGFLTQWAGDDKPLVKYLTSAYPLLNDSEIREWYYAQTVIFWADHLTIIGKFKSAENVLLKFKNTLEYYLDQENSIFQTTRHLGHLFRFNMFLSRANDEYLSTRDNCGHFKNSLHEIYILTNICETNCFFKPKTVFKYCYRGIQLGKRLRDLKSQAKIYYSMGISQLHVKKYRRARKYIRKSMLLNQQDGYKLGLLSSMQANIYLQYAMGQSIHSHNFEKFILEVNVYGFFLLPLAIINDDVAQINQISRQYEWLNFSKTLNMYREFFMLIRP